MSPALAHGERGTQDTRKHLTRPRHLVSRLDNIQSVENADLVSGMYGVDLNVFEEVFGEDEVFDGGGVDAEFAVGEAGLIWRALCGLR